jgi:hypothetical protein
MTTKLKKYGIQTKDGLVTHYALSALEAMNYFYNEGYNVSLKDIIFL